jgi:hypothetical protein
MGEGAAGSTRPQPLGRSRLLPSKNRGNRRELLHLENRTFKPASIILPGRQARHISGKGAGEIPQSITSPILRSSTHGTLFPFHRVGRAVVSRFDGALERCSFVAAPYAGPCNVDRAQPLLPTDPTVTAIGGFRRAPSTLSKLNLIPRGRSGVA